jgi:hypothetical protein
MPVALKHPQLCFDWLIPAGRDKLRLEEVARILSADDGQPVSVRSIRNGLESGSLFGNRIPFAAPVGEEQRIRTDWMTRADVLQALLVTRTAPPAAQLDQLAQITERMSPEAIDELMKILVSQRQRKALR